MGEDINTYLDYIMSKKWASEVRQAIVDAIRECYRESIDDLTSAEIAALIALLD